MDTGKGEWWFATISFHPPNVPYQVLPSMQGQGAGVNQKRANHRKKEVGGLDLPAIRCPRARLWSELNRLVSNRTMTAIFADL
jgi:hypothetical protein